MLSQNGNATLTFFFHGCTVHNNKGTHVNRKQVERKEQWCKYEKVACDGEFESGFDDINSKKYIRFFRKFYKYIRLFNSMKNVN